MQTVWTADEAIKHVATAFGALGFEVAQTGKDRRSKVYVKAPVLPSRMVLIELKARAPSAPGFQIDAFLDFQDAEQTRLLAQLLERKLPRRGELIGYQFEATSVFRARNISTRDAQTKYKFYSSGWNLKTQAATHQSAASISRCIFDEVMPLAEVWEPLALVPFFQALSSCGRVEIDKKASPWDRLFYLGGYQWAVLNFTALAAAGRCKEAQDFLLSIEEIEANHGSAKLRLVGSQDWPVFHRNALAYLDRCL